MAFTREYGLIIFECDECGANVNSGTNDFYDALARIKHLLWLAEYDSQDGHWEHLCKEYRKRGIANGF